MATHAARGVLGLACLGGGLGLSAVIGPAALLLLVPGMAALGGCPTCWAVELAAKLSAGRARRTCVDESCRLEPAGSVASAELHRGAPAQDVSTVSLRR